MAFKTSAQSKARDDSWKASAFLNIYITLKNGQRRKLGAIALKDSRDLDRSIMDRLASGTTEEEQAALQSAFVNALEFDYQVAAAETNSADLAF